MSLYDPDKPLRRGGFTLLELIVALAVAGITVAALVGLFRASLTATRFALRQTSTLSSARKALVSEGPHKGILWAVQGSTAVVNLSPSSLSLVLPGSVSMDYAMQGDILKAIEAGTTYYQAKDVGALSVNYYNINSNGLIQVSTDANVAQYVTVSFTLKGHLAKESTHYLYSGAWLRNK